MFVRASTHRAVIREKDALIEKLAGMVESQSERLLVVAGYRPLMPQRGPVPVTRPDGGIAPGEWTRADVKRDIDGRLADATEL